MAPADGTLPARVLAHLGAHPVAPDARSVPPAVTQPGIADALGARVAHVSRALKRLHARGLVAGHLAHVAGGSRRMRAYGLTREGFRVARELPAPPPPARAPPAPPAAPAPRAPPGREAAFRALVDAFADAARAGPRVALVEGAPGMGKTRLLRAFAAYAEAAGARVLAATAAPAGGAVRLGPLADALAPVGFHDALAAEPAAAGAGERAVAAAARVIHDATREAPLAVLLDDVHHAGADAVTLVHGVAHRLHGRTPCLLVTAFRQDEAWTLPNGPLYRALAPLRALPGAAHVLIPPLDPAGVAALVEEAGADLPAEWVQRILRESGGVPLFARAMVDALADGYDEEDFFPAVVAARVNERLAALPPATLRVLQAAAVIGPAFRFDELLAVHGNGEDAVLDGLDALLDALVLEEVPDAGPADAELRFAHPKVREAVLRDLSEPRRRAVLARAGARNGPRPDAP